LIFLANATKITITTNDKKSGQGGDEKEIRGVKNKKTSQSLYIGVGGCSIQEIIF
jgi:hypothetical protein